MSRLMLVLFLFVGCSMQEPVSYLEELEVMDRIHSKYEAELNELDDAIYDQEEKVAMVKRAKKEEHGDQWPSVVANLQKQEDMLSEMKDRYNALKFAYQREQSQQALRIKSAKEREGR